MWSGRVSSSTRFVVDEFRGKQFYHLTAKTLRILQLFLPMLLYYIAHLVINSMYRNFQLSSR